MVDVRCCTDVLNVDGFYDDYEYEGRHDGNDWTRAEQRGGRRRKQETEKAREEGRPKSTAKMKCDLRVSQT